MKKGVIITIILVVIAVVLAIVFINLFKERDTTEMSNKVVSVVQDGYLDDEKVDGEYVEGKNIPFIANPADEDICKTYEDFYDKVYEG